jgi:tetratricopeptide (TPR) repeat protein
MKSDSLIVALLSMVFLCGCASMNAGSEVAYGRRALLGGDNEMALGYFQSALKTNPSYMYGTAYQQGLLSYVGRTEYLTGRLPQARETLQRALAAKQDEDIARIYLGLTLIRTNDREAGLKDVQAGMRGIYDWLEWVTEAHRFSFGQFWDPARAIRSAIQSDLAMISGRDLDWQRVVTDGEWVAMRMEAEGDKARNDEQRERQRDSEGNDGTR